MRADNLSKCFVVRLSGSRPYFVKHGIGRRGQGQGQGLTSLMVTLSGGQRNEKIGLLFINRSSFIKDRSPDERLVTGSVTQTLSSLTIIR